MKEYIKKYKGTMLFALLFGMIYAALNAYISIALRDVIDIAMIKDEVGFYEKLYHVLLLLLSIGSCYFLHTFFSKRFVVNVVQCLRKDVLKGIFNKNYQDFTSINTADYISSLTNDVKLIEENYFEPLFLCINSVVLFLTSFIIMISLSVSVTMCLFVSMLFMIVIPALFQKTLQNHQDLYSHKLSKLTISMKDLLSGYQIIRTYQMKDHVLRSFDEINEDTMQVKYAWEKINASVETISTVLGSMVQCSVLFLSAYFIMQGTLSAGTLVGLVQISGMIALPIQTISINLPKVQGTKLVIEKLQNHIKYHSTSFVGNRIPSFMNCIQLENVNFAYEKDVPILQSVNMMFEKNKKYVCIGKSGCGKTTMIDLLTGNYSQYVGSIRYDQVELKELNVDQVVQMSAVIHQNVYMFDDTIEQNICLYKDVTMDQLSQALAISGVSSFLDEQKNIQTKVGENGMNLSGGQRQRVALARAFVQRKPILILDEGTSAIDKQTAYDIEDRILSLDDVTLITITHSLNEELLKRYDEIIFMESGCIVEHGSFQVLMRQEGAFAQYFEGKRNA